MVDHMRNLTSAEIDQVSGALYGELLLASAIVTVGFLSYQYWGNHPTLQYDDAMTAYLTQGHCA
jgi:hypothetical protein